MRGFSACQDVAIRRHGTKPSSKLIRRRCREPERSEAPRLLSHRLLAQGTMRRAIDLPSSTGSPGCGAHRAAGRDVEHETTPPTDERGGGSRGIARWPNRITLPALARDLACVLDDVARYIRCYVVRSTIRTSSLRFTPRFWCTRQPARHPVSQPARGHHAVLMLR